MTLTALIISLTLGMGSLAWGYYTSGFHRLALVLALLVVFWGGSLWRRWYWFSSLGLLAAVGAAAYGMWIDLSAGLNWMIAGVAGVLIAWDLTDFLRRLYLGARDDHSRSLERGHIARAVILGVAGMLLGSIPLVINLKFSFEWGVLLVLVAAFGITQLVSWLRHGGQF
ncbi:MAG: hypothetical protein JXA13_12240 [Anaerolineales bacterium]|nr:hypothetical protein [Anaerolineales bacterium]